MERSLTQLGHIMRVSGLAPSLASAPTSAVLKCLVVVCAILLTTACSSPEESVDKYVAAAQKEFAAGNIKSAGLEARNALQIDPKNIDARIVLADIAEQEGDYGELWSHLLVILDERPDDYHRRIRLGELALMGGVPEEARKQADAALQLAANDADVLVLNALVAIQEGDVTAAFRDIDLALELEPGHNAATRLKAQALFSDGKPDEALDLLTTAIGSATDRDEVKGLRQLRTDILSRTGRFDETEDAVQALIGDYPEERDYVFAIAQFYASLDRLDDAERVLRSLVAANPDDLGVRFALLRFLVDFRGESEGIAEIESYIDQAPAEDLPKYQMALADMYVTGGRTTDAVTLYEAVVAEAPISTEGLEARNRLVLYYAENGQQGRADEILTGILEDAPDNSTALLIRGGQAYTDGRYDDAVADFRVAARNDPGSELAIEMLAETHFAANDRLLAKDAYRRLLAINPENAAAKRRLAWLSAAEGQDEQAESLLRESVADDPKDVRSAESLFQLLLSRGDLPGAEEQAETIIQQPDADPGMVAALRGSIFSAKGDKNAAIDAYRQAYQESPSESLLLMLGGELKSAHRYAEAMEMYEAHILKNPDSFVAKNNLASLLLDHQSESAGYQKAVDLLSPYGSSSDSILLDTLGWAHYRAGNYADAERFLTRSTEIQPDAFHGHYHLGMTYVAIENTAAAQAELKKAIQISRDRPADLDEVEAAQKALDDLGVSNAEETEAPRVAQ